MNGVPATSAFDHYRTEVEVMLSYGCALSTIEPVVDRLPLDDDGRSALWLFAWSLADSPDEEPLAEVVPLTR